MMLLLGNDLILQILVFPVLYKNVIVFTAAIWERVKSKPPWERGYKLILAIFGISTKPVEGLLKILATFHHFSYICTIVFYFCASCSEDWVKRQPKKRLFDIF